MGNRLKPLSSNSTDSYQFIDHSSSNYESLKFTQNKLSCQSGSALVMGCSTLGEQFKFTIKIEKTDKNKQPIWMGISRKERANEEFINNQFFYSQNFRIFLKPQNTKEFQEPAIGDLLTIIGDQKRNVINFKMNNECSLALKYEFQDHENNWVPYVCLSEGDEVSIVEFFPQANLTAIHMCLYLFEFDFDVVFEVNKIIDLVMLKEEGQSG